jgi:hypothetical protein
VEWNVRPISIVGYCLSLDLNVIFPKGFPWNETFLFGIFHIFLREDADFRLPAAGTVGMTVLFRLAFSN